MKKVMLVPLLFSVVYASNSISRHTPDGHKDPAAIVYSDNHSTYPVAHAFRVGSKTAITLGQYAAKQWLNGPQNLILANGTKVYALGKSNLRFLIDVNDILPGVIANDSTNLVCAFDSREQRLALTSSDGDVEVLDIPTRKLVYQMPIKRLEKVIQPSPDGTIDHGGICWSSDDTRIAVAVPSTPPPRSTSGVGPAQCVIFPFKGSPKSIGLGTPVCWITDKEILCLEEGGNGYVYPAVLSTGDTTRKQYRHMGLEVGWDGSHVLLSHIHTVDVISADLKRKIRTLPMPGHRDPRSYWPYCPLIGIPKYPGELP